MIPGQSLSGTEFPGCRGVALMTPVLGAVTGASPAGGGGRGGESGRRAQVPDPVCSNSSEPWLLCLEARVTTPRCLPGRVVPLLWWPLFRDPSSDGPGTPPPLPQHARPSWVAGTLSPVSASRPREWVWGAPPGRVLPRRRLPPQPCPPRRAPSCPSTS